jgi:flagellar basal body P-ring formation protein FlgA
MTPNPVLRLVGLVTVLLAATAPARATAIEAEMAEQVQQFAAEATRQSGLAGLRVQISVGRLDPRLRLAPCTTVQPYLPTGTRLWGAARIGLRCTDAAVRWNVYLPIQVDVFGPALVAAAALPAGHVLIADDLRNAEVNLAATRSPAMARQELAVGRALSRPLAAGDTLRGADLRARQWFAAGDNVRLVAAGSGWRINGEGQALAAGVEGQSVRVRTESGRVVSGVPVAERLVEVVL